MKDIFSNNVGVQNFEPLQIQSLSDNIIHWRSLFEGDTKVGAILFINDDDEKLRKIFEKVLYEHGCAFENNLCENAENEDADEVIKKWIKKALASDIEKNFFDFYMDRFASLLISEALKITAGNRSKAAKMLGLSRPTLHSRIEKYGLKLETFVKQDKLTG